MKLWKYMILSTWISFIRSSRICFLLDLNLPVVDGHFICWQGCAKQWYAYYYCDKQRFRYGWADQYEPGLMTLWPSLQSARFCLPASPGCCSAPMSMPAAIYWPFMILHWIYRSTLTWKGNSIDLTKNELRIIWKHCLFQNKNKIVSCNELMQHMWDCSVCRWQYLTVNINRLRKKLEYLRLDDLFRQRGMGYIIWELIIYSGKAVSIMISFWQVLSRFCFYMPFRLTDRSFSSSPCCNGDGACLSDHWISAAFHLLSPPGTDIGRAWIRNTCWQKYDEPLFMDGKIIWNPAHCG